MNHNDVVEHIFSTTGEKNKGIKGKDTLLYSRVRMCARKEKKKSEERRREGEREHQRINIGHSLSEEGQRQETFGLSTPLKSTG